jgi:hypothetical protein
MEGERDYMAEVKDQSVEAAADKEEGEKLPPEAPAYMRRPGSVTEPKCPTRTELVMEHEATALAAILMTHAEYAANIEIAMAEAENKITHAQHMRDQRLATYEKR